MATLQDLNALHQAIDDDMLDKVQLLLSKGRVHPDMRATWDNAPPLHHAIQIGHAEIAECLLRHGADPNLTLEENGVTPLFIAVEEQRLDLIQLLLKNRANPDATRTDKPGVTLLHILASRGWSHLIPLIIQAGAYINPQLPHNGETPLYKAVLKGQAAAVKTLLTYGANPNLRRTDNGATPLFAAAEQGNLELVLALINTPDIDRTQPIRLTQQAFMEFKDAQPIEIQTRMNHWLATQTTAGASVSITPAIIAFLMGHHTIALLIGYQPDLFHAFMTLTKKIDQIILKKRTDPAYERVAAVGKYLQNELNNAFDQHLAYGISTSQFKARCDKAIQQARGIFAQHRGYWNTLHPILRWITGILATLTIIPALIVAKTTHHGYVHTFFRPTAPKSSLVLKSFETQLHLNFQQKIESP